MLEGVNFFGANERRYLFYLVHFKLVGLIILQGYNN